MVFKNLRLAAEEGRGRKRRREVRRKGEERRENKVKQDPSPKALQH